MVIELVLASYFISITVARFLRLLLKNIPLFLRFSRTIRTSVTSVSFRRRMMHMISIVLWKPLLNSSLGIVYRLYGWMELLSCVRGRWVSISGIVVSLSKSLLPMLIRRTVRWNDILG